MSDPYASWGTVDDSAPSRRKRGLYLAAAAAVAVLAAIGGTAGYMLAGSRGTPEAVGPGEPSTSASAPSSAPPSTRPGSASGSSPRADAFRLPDVTGKDFEQARKDLRELRLGVQLYFGSSGDDRRVDRSDPGSGDLVFPGKTVKLYVRGRPPIATVPNVVGLACDEGGKLVAEHGLMPEYPNGRAGRVLRQDPEPPTDTVRWNDPVRLYCGTASPSPSPAGG